MITIVIPTVGRVRSLRALLSSLVWVNSRQAIEHEILVVNNACDGDLPKQVSDTVAEFASKTSVRVDCLREPVPGKSRAMNRGICAANGSILAFLDDDVVADHAWLPGVHKFFLSQQYDAMQGRVLFPPDKQADQEFHRLWNRYRTIVHVDFGDSVRQFRTLKGANFAIRSQVISQVGSFDERIGPGQTGTSEDVHFSQKMLMGGLSIGYAPDAIVYHEIDPTRLTDQYFCRQHEAQGRSRQTYKNNSLFKILSDLGWAIIKWGWYWALRNERRMYRAKGRFYHYRAMLLHWSGLHSMYRWRRESGLE
jgi:GT2 family glycosyltransferase